MANNHDIFSFDSESADRRAVDTVQEMIGSMRATIQLARSFANTDRTIDLAGLDRDVGLLCARALDLPEKLGRRVRPELDTLRSELEALALVLQPTAPTRS